MNARFAALPLFQLAILVRRKFLEVRVLQTAGALTYTTLLSLVPMITVVLTVMRRFSPFMKLGEGMRNFLLQNLLPDRAGKVVATYALQFSEKASSLTIVGTVFLVVTAVMLFATIDRTLNSIWGVRRPRPWFVRIPVYWLALTLGPVILAGSIAATGGLMQASLELVDEAGWVHKFADRATTALLLSLLFAFMFHVIPNRRLKLLHGVIGGLVAGIGVVVMQRLFGFYLSKLPNFTLIYGTFSVVPIFLIWVYVTWFIVLLGATIAAVLPDFESRYRQLPPTQAGRTVAVVRLVQALAVAQASGRAMTVDDLATSCRQSPAHAEQMLEDMRQTGWVVRTEEGSWMLCVAADAITLGELLARMVIGVSVLQATEPRLSQEDKQLLRATIGHMRESLSRSVTAIDQIG